MILKWERERKLVKDFMSSEMILKQEGKLVKGFSSGMIPERIGRILVVIVRLASKSKESEYSISSIWDELNFERENNKIIMSGMDKREIGNRKSHIIGNVTYKGQRIINKDRKIIDIGRKDGRKRRRCCCTKSKTRMEQQQDQQQQQNPDPAGQQQQHLHINWSNFKPEFS